MKVQSAENPVNSPVSRPGYKTILMERPIPHHPGGQSNGALPFILNFTKKSIPIAKNPKTKEEWEKASPVGLV